MVRCLSALIAVLSFLIAFPPVASSQKSTGETADASLTPPMGSLGGHVFIPSSYIKDPFVRTFFRTGLGFGMTPEMVAPSVTIDSTPVVGSRGSLLFAVLDVEYQQAIRSWIAVRFRLHTLGRMADETPALIAQGVTLVSGFEFTWLFRLAESDRLTLSGSLGLQNSSVTDVYLQRFIEGIIQEGEITKANQLVQTTPTLRFGGGAHGAYAISTLTGLTFSGELEYGEQMDRSAPDKLYYRLAAAFDFDLGHDGGTPIGFVVGASTRTSPETETGTDNSSQTFFGRVAYTGNRNFALGLDLSYSLTPIRGMSEKQAFASAVVDIRLYF